MVNLHCSRKQCQRNVLSQLQVPAPNFFQCAQPTLTSRVANRIYSYFLLVEPFTKETASELDRRSRKRCLFGRKYGMYFSGGCPYKTARFHHDTFQVPAICKVGTEMIIKPKNALETAHHLNRQQEKFGS